MGSKLHPGPRTLLTKTSGHDFQPQAAAPSPCLLPLYITELVPELGQEEPRLCAGDVGLQWLACYGRDSNRSLSAVAYLGLLGFSFESGSLGQAGFEPTVFLILFYFPAFRTGTVQCPCDA